MARPRTDSVGTMACPAFFCTQKTARFWRRLRTAWPDPARAVTLDRA